MTALINASTSSGVVVTSDTSGSLAFQSNGTTIMTVTSTGVTTQVGAPAFSANGSALQSLSSGTYTKIAYNTKIFDTATCYDTTNYRFTPNVAGYYQVNGSINLVGTAIILGLCSIYKNGSEFKRGNALTGVSTGQAIINVSSIIYLNGTSDYVTLYAYVSGASPVLVSGTGAWCYFQAAMIRSA